MKVLLTLVTAYSWHSNWSDLMHLGFYFLSGPARRRFYKSVSVAGNAGMYEVNLDHRKLKTPYGNVLQVGTVILTATDN